MLNQLQLWVDKNKIFAQYALNESNKQTLTFTPKIWTNPSLPIRLWLWFLFIKFGGHFQYVYVTVGVYFDLNWQ